MPNPAPHTLGFLHCFSFMACTWYLNSFPLNSLPLGRVATFMVAQVLAHAISMSPPPAWVSGFTTSRVLSCLLVYFPGCDPHPSGWMGLMGLGRSLSALGSSLSLPSRALAFWEGTSSAVSLLLRAEGVSCSFVMVSGQDFAKIIKRNQ